MSDLADAPARHPCGCPCTCDVPWDEELRADAYERGRAIESARAESRQALGLPLSREPA